MLRAWKLGESDRIVSLHTHGHGKVRCVAKGVRRTRSKFGARLEPGGHIAVQLYRGRGGLDTIVQIDLITRFLSLWHDPDRFVSASAMLEAVEHLSLERQPNIDMHVMLVRALATLDRNSSPLVLAGFLLKLLMLEGVQPVLNRCVTCNTDKHLRFISFGEGGVKCQECDRGHGTPISSTALEIIRMTLQGRLAVALRHSKDAAVPEVMSVASQAMELHLERRLRSLRVVGN